MGVVEDLRKLLQDVVSPDLKALDARVVDLEKKLDIRFASLEARIDYKADALDKRSLDAEKKLDGRLSSLEGRLDDKIDLKVDLLMGEIRALTAVVASNHATVMHALDIDRRMERIESQMAAASKSNQPA